MKKKKLIRLISQIILFLVILVLILLALQFNFLDPLKDYFKKPKLYKINDECSLILNNLLHKIKNEDECRVACNNECGIRDSKLHELNFLENNAGCNTCECYCK